MNTSTISFSIVNSAKTKFSDAQFLLREWTGKNFNRTDADNILKNILNHKWNMSEKLGRDVGLRVATVDFIDNFYQPDKENESAKNEINILTFLRSAVCKYFESKGHSAYF